MTKRNAASFSCGAVIFHNDINHIRSGKKEPLFASPQGEYPARRKSVAPEPERS
jgi:hypothetical protein